MILARKLLAPTLILLVILLAGLFGYFYTSLHNASHASEEASMESFSDSFKADLANQERLALSLALQSANSVDVREAMAKRDAQMLASISDAAYTELAARSHIVTYQFHLPDGALLYSASSDANVSPFIASPAVMAVNSDHQPVSGLAISGNTLGIVGVAPVFHRGNYIGCIEIAVGLDASLLSQMKEKYGGDWRILLVQGLASSTVNAPLVEDSSFVVFASTQGNEITSTSENYLRVQEGETTIIHPTVDGNSYAVLSSPLYDFSGNLLGALDIVYNHTHLTNQQNSRIAIAGLVTLGVLLIGAFILVASTRRTLSPIQALTRVAAEITEGHSASFVNVESEGDEIGVLIRAFNRMTTQLRGSISNLEQRIAERTLELEQQATRLRAATEISQFSAAERDLNKTLERAGHLLMSRLECSFVGIYLLEKDGAHAILASSPTKAGKSRIQQKFRLPVNYETVVGFVAKTGEARIAPDVRFSATQFSDTFLPESRSEIILALKSENKTIGVLDIHSEKEDAFRQADLSIMQIIADQLSSAIERSRLSQESSRYLSDLEQAYGRNTREGWRKFIAARQLQNRGYRFDNIRIEPFEEISGVGRKAIEQGITVSAPGASTNQEIAIPIKFRGQTIGIVQAKLREGSGETIVTTLEQAIDRLASSLESARLYEEAQIRANREQAISQIASLIGSSSDYESILRTTAREIGNVLTDTDVIIQLASTTGDDGTA
ncbi:MAG: GAF domain-containing protein [Anaerolineae bacterium]|nr:GAF domain-containing protein [Anaerolineae bacterium]MBL8105270.1 GAF domain-containing protein [Anaerolineales bacterium]MCC7187695.1 GAF domain-containing protein [Anaerolineales bacterium]